MGAALTGGQVTVEAGQTLTLDGTTVTGSAITDSGMVRVDAGQTLHLIDTTVSGGSINNQGIIEVQSGIVRITGDISGAGSSTIDAGATLALDGSSNQSITFAGTNATLELGSSSSFAGSVIGIAAGDKIDLQQIQYGPATTGVYANGVLTITDGTHSIGLHLVGDYSNANFVGSADGTGTLITLKAVDDAPVIANGEATQAPATPIVEAVDNSAAEIGNALYHQVGVVHFTDVDLTDRPTATQTRVATYTAADGHTSLTLTDDQAAALIGAFTIAPEQANANNGALDWSYDIHDNALDFLAQGETVTVQSTIVIDDQRAGTGTATVTITIQGTNDAPTIQSGSTIAQEAVTEDTLTPDSQTLSTSGSIAFQDPRLDRCAHRYLRPEVV